MCSLCLLVSTLLVVVARSESAATKELPTMSALQKVTGIAAIDLSALLDAGAGAVVTLEAGQTRLAAHRAVLAARSPVFAAMFANDTQKASSGVVTIPDVEGAVLRQLVSYLYTLQVPQLPGMAAQLLAAADKYGLSDLKAACEQQVLAQLSVETAAATAVLAVRHSCDSLRQAAIQFVKNNFVDVVGTQGWADAMLSQPKDLIEVSRLISVPLAETSAPAPAEGRTSPQTATQPDGDHRDQRHAAHSAATTSDAYGYTAQPEDVTVSRLRSFSTEKQGRRLIQAARVGEVDKLESLLAAGADVGATDVGRMTALHWAAREGHVEAARRLLAAGATVDARNGRHSTPLHSAGWKGHAAVARLLLDSGAYHSARNKFGYTPLHYAAEYGHREVAAALLKAGADREAKDNSGDTPLGLARRKNHQLLVNLLTTTS